MCGMSDCMLSDRQTYIAPIGAEVCTCPETRLMKNHKKDSLNEV